MMLSSLSLSGSGGLPSKASTLPSSKATEKVGMMMYWRICREWGREGGGEGGGRRREGEPFEYSREAVVAMVTNLGL